MHPRNTKDLFNAPIKAFFLLTLILGKALQGHPFEYLKLLQIPNNFMLKRLLRYYELILTI